MAVNIGPKIAVEGEKQFRNQLTQIASSVNKLGARFDALASQMDTATNKEEHLKKATETLKAQTEAQGKIVSEQKKHFEEQKKAVEDLARAVEKATAEYGENSTEVGKLKAQYNSAVTSANKYEQSIIKNETELGKMNAKLDATKTKLVEASAQSSKIGKLSASFEKIQPSIDKASASLGKITKAAAAAGASLAGVALAKGWARMTSIDNAKAKLKALGNSAKSVGDIMDNALASVKGTSYGMDAAATTAASAVAAGIKPGKQLEKYLSLVADAAAVAGTDMSEMGSIFNKVATNGKISADEINQLADRGIPAMTLLAKATGKSMTEVRKDVESGKVGIDDLTKAIEIGMGGAAQTMGTSTITGAISNIGASLSRIGANFLGASDNADSFAGKVLPLLNSLSKKLAVVEEKATVLGGIFAEKFTKALEVLSSIPAPLYAIGGGLAVGTAPALSLASKIMTLTESLTAFKVQLALAKAGMGASTLATIAHKTAVIASTTATTLATNAQKLFNVAVKANPIGAMVTAVLLLVGVLATLQAKGKDVTGAIDNFTEKAIEKIDKIAEQAPKMVKQLVEGLASNLPKLITAGGKLIIAIVKGIVESLPKIIASAPKIIKALVEAIGSILYKLVTAGGKMVASITKGILEKLGSLTDVGGKIITAVGSAITGKLDRLASVGSKMISKIKTAISNKMSDMASIGGNIVAGLWNGITNKFSWLTAKIQGFATSVKEKLKGFFGIHSPSKWAEKELGYNIDRGVGIGIEKNIGFIKDPIKKISGLSGKTDFSANPVINNTANLGIDYSRLASILSDMGIYIDGRQIGRTLAKGGGIL